MNQNRDKKFMEYKSQNVVCQNCKAGFTIEPEDFNFYEKIKVPPPTFCPECRMIRRFTWRNERTLYHNICAFSKKKIISMFAPETNLTVYDHDIWWSDKWDPLSYGMEYDFSQPFFEQYKELLSLVPLQNLGNNRIIRSEYGNHNLDCKNCYLVYASFSNENVSYSQGVVNVKDSFDLYSVMKSEQCYEDILCASVYRTHFSYDSDECLDSMFLTSCLGLQHCLGCINLRHKKYYIFNKQFTQKEYEEKVAEYDFGSYKILNKFKGEYADFLQMEFRRFAFVFKSVNVTGDNVMNSKNSKMIFDIYGGVEDSKYLTHAVDIKDSYDGYGAGGINAKVELLYEAIDTGVNSAKNLFSILTHECLETNYTYMCFGSDNLFGCIGLRKYKYCILNKRYSKEEYEQLLPKIVKHMNEMPYVDKKGRVYKYGEFFPTEISPFAYNETIAQEYFPLNKKNILEKGYKWKEKETRNYQLEINPKNLPDHIKDVGDEIIGRIIGCLHGGECDEQCTEAFKILPEELQFYKKMNFALPRLCPNCRHYQRLKKRNPLKLWHRSCMCDKENHAHKGNCEVQFETSYAPDRPEIVYCEKCYQAEVY